MTWHRGLVVLHALLLLLLLGPTALAGRVPGTLAARPLTHGPGSKVVGGDGFDFASLKASANFAAISYCHNITAIAGRGLCATHRRP